MKNKIRSRDAGFYRHLCLLPDSCSISRFNTYDSVTHLREKGYALGGHGMHLDKSSSWYSPPPVDHFDTPEEDKVSVECSIEDSCN